MIYLTLFYDGIYLILLCFFYVIKEGEIYGAPKRRKRQRNYSNYVELMINLVDEEPTRFEEALKLKEWMQDMIK